MSCCCTLRRMMLLASATGLFLAGDSGASAAPPEAAAVERLDLQRPGSHRADRWEYRFTITAPGSKSEGARGELFFDGKRVEEPERPGEYYRTPWGELAWVGDPQTLWGEHGWMPRDPGTVGGNALVEPWRAAGAPVVMAMVLAPGGPAEQGAPEPWLQAELARLGVARSQVLRGWFPLTDQAIVLHDTKAHGTLTARQALARDESTLQVLLGGSEPLRIDLARQDGTTRLVRHTLRQGLDPLELYLALRVERAAPWWAPPFEVGPDADGKTVEVREAHEIVIALPGDQASGNVWTVSAGLEDPACRAAVKVLGEPQFVAAPGAGGAARPGTFENLLRVVDTGTCEVRLAYHRPWQTDAPPERSYRVTLRIVELPSRGATRWPGGAK